MGNPLAETDAAEARAEQDDIDIYDAAIDTNWGNAKTLWTTVGPAGSGALTSTQASNFVSYFTNMSTNSTNISSSASSTDPTDVIITETNNVAIRTDTDPNDHYRLITVTGGGDLTLINARLYGGYSDSAVVGTLAAGRGGAIYIDNGASATLINVDVTKNSNADASLFTGNQSSNEGGAIYNAGSLTVYEDASLWTDPDDPSQSISNNKAGTSGGAIYSTGDLNLKGPGVNETVSISNNSANGGSGGGIYSEGTISLMENISLSSNTASEHGGGAYITSINDALELKNVNFYSNTATNGSGGGLAYVDSPGALTMIQLDMTSNTAKINGGAIYMENTGDFTYLGTRYISDTDQFCYENMHISSNSVSDGEGGAFYLSRVGDVLLNSLDFNSNSGDNDTANPNLGGGAIKMTNSGNLSIIDSNFINNDFGDNVVGNGGAIDYDGGTSGANTLSINTSFFRRNGWAANNGGAIYQTAGNLNIVNSTFDNNWPYGDGGAIWMNSSVDLIVNFVTFVNNTVDNDVADSGGSIFVATAGGLTGSITINNTIIFNSTTNGRPQIELPTGFTISSSSHNIFSHYYDYGVPAQGLADGTVTSATNYLDANQNYVGTGSDTTLGSKYIQDNLHISTTAVFTANYKTYTLALTDESSIAYRSGLNNGVTYDQRGNTRTVDAYGNAITSSRGAFEPIFNLVVNSTADDTTMLRSDPAGYYANRAWADGVTLREAAYWVDSGDGEDTGVVSFNDGTYSGHNFHAADADNKITLNGNQITIGQFRRGYSSDKTMTINGVAASQDAANRVIVDANNASRVFCIIDGTTKMNHLTLQNGNAPAPGSDVEVLGTDTYGGAIYNNSGSALILNNVLVQNSTANAVSYKGTGYGGGIYNSGTLTLNDTTVTGNQAIAVADSEHVQTNGGQGGGIYSSGTLSLYRSTIDNNSTTGNQYVTQSAKGGGIYNANGDLYIENSTIAYNHNMPSAGITTGGEGSAIYFTGGDDFTIINSTIANNHTSSNNEDAVWNLKSAVYVNSHSSVTITNSILADNYVDQKVGDIIVGHWNDFYVATTPTAFNTTYNVVGFFNYGDYDFEGNTGTIVGQYLTVVGNPERGHVENLHLNPTLDYRGGRTQVLSLLEGSVLLDLATNPGADVTLAPIRDYMTGVTLFSNTDQRGNARVNGSYSIGSYQPIFAITVDLATDGTDTNHGWNWTNNTQGWASDNNFRDALYWVDPTGTITMDAAVAGETISLNSALGQLLIEKSMTIVGDGITLQAAATAGTATNRVMQLTNPSHLSTTITVLLQNMTIENGVGSHGGGIYNTSNLTLEGVTVQNNKADSGHGGGIYSLGGSLTIQKDGTVYSNITGNTAKNRGGGIYYEGASNLIITQADVLDNEALEGSGGGVYVTGANLTLTQSTIGNNTAKINGGGINSMSTDITMVNSTIANNTSGELGGGLAFFIGGTLDMNFVTIANNISGTNTAVTALFGGGIYTSAGTLNMTNSVVAQNYRTSISSSNRDDFYVGATITTGTVSYSAFGQIENFTIPVSNNIHLGNTTPWANFGLDTVLTDNGGPTSTLYVFNTDSVLQNGATPNSGATITTDQRGIARPATGQPTIGAYQKNITEWVYTGNASADFSELNDITNWTKVSGVGAMGSVGAPDQTLYFDPTLAGATGTDNVIITESWNVNYKASVVLDNVAHLTLTGAPLPADPILFTAGLTVMGGSIFTVGANAAFASIPNTNLTLTGSASEIIVNNTFSATINVTDGTLELNVEDDMLSNLTLGTINAASTIVYGYAGDQTVRTGTYGNLTLSGGGTKTANGAITAADTVTVDASTFTLGGTLSSDDITLSNGIISGGSYGITSTGDLNTTGTSSITGGTISLTTATNITGSVTASNALTISGAATLNSGTLSGASINLAGDLTADGVNNIVTSDAITVDFTSADITVNAGDSLKFSSSNDFILDAVAVSTANTFNVTDISVNATGSLEFLTTGDVTLNAITGADADNINGNLILRGQDIDLNGATINNATITLGNTNNLNIDAGGFTSGNSVIFDGIVNITGSGATISSTTGNLTFNENIIGNAKNFNITAGSGSVSIADVTNAGALVITAGTTATMTNIAGSSLTVNSSNGIALDGTINMTGAVALNDAVSVDTGDTASVTGNTLVIGGAVTGAGNLSLGATSTAALNGGVNMTGDLSLNDGTFTTNSNTVDVADLSILSPATLTMGNNALTASGSLTNAGTLTSSNTITAGTNITNSNSLITTGAVEATTGYINNTGTFSAGSATVGGNLTNTNSFTATTTATVGGDITNSGSTFTVPTLNASGDITNTGTMTVATALNLNGTGTSTLSLDGAFNTGTLTIASGKEINMTSGDVTAGTFTFTNATSKFALASGTNMRVTNTLNYNSAYFNTSGGGTLGRDIAGGGSAVYRVGDSSKMAVVTLTGDTAGTMTVGLIDSVRYNGGVVTGIEDTAGFTINISGYAGNITGATFDWDNAWNGSGFPSGTDTESLFELDSAWTAGETVNITVAARSSTTTSTAFSSGTFAFANTTANMTIPITNLNGNDALFEMANPNFGSMFGFDLDIDNLTNFPIGTYPYFSSRGIFGDADSVGQTVYRQMEYRLAMNPLSNPLTGQVPTTGALLGEAITEGASLNLTSDASAYLEANGEYSIGKGWLPISEPASASNIEQYQAPITEGQLDEFYLEFGGREGVFDKPASFKSGLDEILDDLLAG